MAFTRTLLRACGLALLIAGPAAAEQQISLDGLAVEARIERRGNDLAVGHGALWVKSGFEVLRIDSATRALTAIPLRGASQSQRRIAAGEGAVWIADAGADRLYRIDPASNAVVLEIPVTLLTRQGSLGFGDGSIWLMAADDRGFETRLARFDATTGALQSTLDLPTGAIGLVHAAGSLWATSGSRNALYRVDPRTNALLSVIETGDAPRSAVYGAGHIWVHCEGDATVQKFDASTGELAATIATDLPLGRGSDIDFGGGSLWIGTDFLILQIDPGTDLVVRRFTGAKRVAALRYEAGALWIGHNTIERILLPD